MDNAPTSRTIDLEVDSGSGQLGSRPPREIEDGTRRAEGQDFLKWGVRADVTSLQHGLYEGKPASLIAFEFRFLCDNDSSRFSEAKIVVTFDAFQDGTKERKSMAGLRPIVERYCPKHIEGPVTKGDHSSEIDLHASLAGPDTLPIKPEIGISRTNGVGYVKDYTMKIKGTRWSTIKLEPDDQVRWTLTENSLQGDGIPMDFKAAILLQHRDQPYQGTVKIQTKTKLGMRLFGWPWSAPNPLLFKPDVSFGLAMGFSDFDQLTDEHWKQLCDLHVIVSACRWTDKSDLIRQSI